MSRTGATGLLAGSQSRLQPSVIIESTMAVLNPVCCMLANQHGEWDGTGPGAGAAGMWERRLSGLSRLSFDVYEAEALEPFRRDAAAALTLNRRCRLSGSARMTEGPGLEGAGRRRPSPGGPGDLRRVVLPPVRVCGPSQEHSMRISVGHPARAGRRSRGDWRESCDELPTELRVKLELRDGPGPCRRRGLVTRRALKHPAACPPCRAAPMSARCRPPPARSLRRRAQHGQRRGPRTMPRCGHCLPAIACQPGSASPRRARATNSAGSCPLAPLAQVAVRRSRLRPSGLLADDR